MTEAHPARHRERLVLSLDDEGLQNLALRLVLPDWPNAHRTYRGPDGGVDVFSDYGLPPQRGWQCKNYAAGAVDWGKCRNSLKAATDERHPPRHYTFVFPRALKKTDHDYWRETFVPWASQQFGDMLPTLDYWDDLPDRLKDRPDLVDMLDDGALAGYMRKVMAQTAADGFNPLATASDHVDDAAKAAERAKAIGKADPYFAYGEGGREANAADSDLPPDRQRFTMDRTREDALPRYTVAVRRGDAVHEFTAAPCEGVELRRGRFVFAPDDEGRALHDHVRRQLAKGRPVTLHDPRVHVDPGDVPDKFRHLADEDGLLRDGELVLGLSQPLTLVVRMIAGATILREEITLYRIPELPGDRTAWGGSVGGTILFIDLRPVPDEDGEFGNQVAIIINVVSGFHGETPDQALRGLGFACAFALADSRRLECHCLLKADGLTIVGASASDPKTLENLVVTGLIAQALADLELRDPRGRTMPRSVGLRDAAVAKTVLKLFRQGDTRHDVADAEFKVPLPSHAQPSDDLARWMTHVQPLPEIAERPTLRVLVAVEGATPLRITDADDGQCVLACRNDGAASVVMRLHDFGEQRAPTARSD